MKNGYNMQFYIANYVYKYLILSTAEFKFYMNYNLKKK